MIISRIIEEKKPKKGNVSRTRIFVPVVGGSGCLVRAAGARCSCSRQAAVRSTTYYWLCTVCYGDPARAVVPITHHTHTTPPYGGA